MKNFNQYNCQRITETNAVPNISEKSAEKLDRDLKIIAKQIGDLAGNISWSSQLSKLSSQRRAVILGKINKSEKIMANNPVGAYHVNNLYAKSKKLRSNPAMEDEFYKTVSKLGQYPNYLYIRKMHDRKEHLQD